MRGLCGCAERARVEYERRCPWKPLFMWVPAQSSWLTGSPRLLSATVPWSISVSQEELRFAQGARPLEL